MIKVGDKVRMTEEGHLNHGDGEDNPRGVVGVVTIIHSHWDLLPIQVEWHGCLINSYDAGDLEVVRG